MGLLVLFLEKKERKKERLVEAPQAAEK